MTLEPIFGTITTWFIDSVFERVSYYNENKKEAKASEVNLTFLLNELISPENLQREIDKHFLFHLFP